jgi:hypothetical protein
MGIFLSVSRHSKVFESESKISSHAVGSNSMYTILPIFGITTVDILKLWYHCDFTKATFLVNHHNFTLAIENSFYKITVSHRNSDIYYRDN